MQFRRFYLKNNRTFLQTAGALYPIEIANTLPNFAMVEYPIIPIYYWHANFLLDYIGFDY